MGTYAIPPGGALPAHRHLDREVVWFVHKGQGRATVEGRSATILPGMTVTVPRQRWCSLRNTGTGLLQLAWTASPTGLEALFRELAQPGTPASPTALQDVGRRHGMEFRLEGEPQPSGAPARQPPHRRSRRRHRGRGGSGQGSAKPAPSISAEASSATQPPLVTTQTVSLSLPAAGRPSRHRRRHRRGHQRPQPTSTATSSGSSVQGAPKPALRPASSTKPDRSAAGRSRRPPRQYRGRVKEVYMGGRWVRVSGEGPVVAGEEGQEA